jgi:hypothetical protein
MNFRGMKMSDGNLATAVAYYQGLQAKDISGIARLVHPEIELVGPIANARGKEAFLKSIERLAGAVKAVTVRATCGSGDEVMTAYDLDFGEPVGVCRTAALMNFREGFISRLELFFDTKPFAGIR